MAKDESRPETNSMIDRSGSLSDQRMKDMRATFSLRREAEAFLVEAGQLRRRAADDADALITEAETLSEEVLAEARAEAEQLVREARQTADALLETARKELETAREEAERARAVAEAEEARSHEVVEEVERRLGGLAPVLQEAATTVADARDALGSVLGGGTATAVLEAVPENVPHGPQEVAVVAEEDADDARDEHRAVAVAATVQHGDATKAEPAADDARPLGWLFRPNQG